MVKYLQLFLYLLLLASCSPSSLEGEVVSYKGVGQSLTEYLVKTNDQVTPYLKTRTNKPSLKIGSKVRIENLGI